MMQKRIKRFATTVLVAALFASLLTGCSGHMGYYPVNEPLPVYNQDYGYIGKNMQQEGSSDELLLILSFSGGGTRAAAFAYGVLEELRGTEVSIGGRQQSLINEVDMISGVSGGSFTAAYFGLFGERIFDDFETRFLKKNIQGQLMAKLLLNPYNWLRVSSPFFDRSDLASEFYEENVFDGKTFGDLLNRKGPVILINATDMSLGSRFTFHQHTFNVMCSDLSKFSVARACAASSAVPGVLSPVVLKNYAGICGYVIPPTLEEESRSYRQREVREDLLLITDSEKKSYFHLIDGGVADNLGLRAIEESIETSGNIWEVMKYTGREKVRKIAFVVVNAESKLESMWNNLGTIPPLATIVSNYSTIAIARYNRETMAILQENFQRWSHQIRSGRCPQGQMSREPGSCGDIKFYLVDVRFKNLNNQAEADYLAGLPTSFWLESDDVDRLRSAARLLTSESVEFRRLIKDLKKPDPLKDRSVKGEP